MDNGVAEKIKELRLKANLSQEQLAKKIGISRPAITQLENRSRDVCADELIKLAEIFEVTTDNLLGLEKEPEILIEKEKKPEKADIRISVPALNKDKFKQVLLYILERCAGKPNVGKTVLYKLLFFADFNFFELYERHMTGAKYMKFKHGPVPYRFSDIIAEMEKNKEIKGMKTTFGKYEQERFIPLVKSDLSKLQANEKEVLDNVINLLSDLTASQISTYSHGDITWKATKDNEPIEYDFVFYRVPPYSVRAYPDDDEE